MYHEINIALPQNCDPIKLDLLAAHLQGLNCLGWQENENPSSWTAWFSEEQSLAEIQTSLDRFLSENFEQKPKTDASALEDRDWTEPFREFFHAQKVEPCWWIAPPWEVKNVALKENETLLVIEPGMAFGTGLHETTRLCLSMLPDWVKPETQHLLDVGAGSGVLSIAALKLGAAKTTCVELDPQAEENLHLNLQHNGAAEKAEVLIGNLADQHPEPADLLVCNMLMKYFKPISAHARSLLAENGTMILSGYLEGEREEATELITSFGLKIVSEKSLGEWIAFVAKS